MIGNDRLQKKKQKASEKGPRKKPKRKVVHMKQPVSGATLKGKSWVPLGEYPRYIPTYTTYIWIIQWLYRAIWGNIGGTTARVHSQGYPTFPFETR